LAALSVAVVELAKEQGITDDDLRIRQDIVEEMSKVIMTFLPGTRFILYIYFIESKIFFYFLN
jgi:terminal uridylyltransferase